MNYKDFALIVREKSLNNIILMIISDGDKYDNAGNYWNCAHYGFYTAPIKTFFDKIN